MKRLFSVPDTDGTSNQLTAAVQVCHTIIASHTRPCGACEDRPGEGWGRTRWEVARQTWGSAEPASMKAPGQHTCWQELIRMCMRIADTLLCSLGCFLFKRLLGPLVLWYINKISIFFLFLKMKSQWQYFVLLVRHLAWEEPHNESGYDDNDTAKSISHHMQKNSWSVGGQLFDGEGSWWATPSLCLQNLQSSPIYARTYPSCSCWQRRDYGHGDQQTFQRRNKWSEVWQHCYVDDLKYRHWTVSIRYQPQVNPPSQDLCQPGLSSGNVWT